MSSTDILFSFDVGGTNTRYSINNGKPKRFSTDYSVVPLDTPMIKELAHAKEEFIVTFPNGKKVYLLKGDAVNAHSAPVEGVDAHTFKVLTPGTIYNIVYSIARTGLSLNLENKTIYIAQTLPPAELYGGFAPTYKESLAGTYEITFPYLNKEIRFTIKSENILLAPEGIVCRALLPKNERKSLLQYPTLSIDVGYRSTDLALLIKGKPVEGSAISKPHGGYNAQAFVSSALERIGMYVPKQEIIDTIIPFGNYQGTNLTEITNAARRLVADTVYTDISSMFGAMPQYSLHSVRNLLLNGRLFSTPSIKNKDLMDMKQLLLSRFQNVHVFTLEDNEYSNLYAIAGMAVKQWKLNIPCLSI